MRVLKDKRGVALETAVVFLLLIFCFCFMISMISMLGVQRARREKIQNGLLIEQEQLAEDFLAYVESGENDFSAFVQGKYSTYEMEEERIGTQVSLILKKNGEEVLYLCADKGLDGSVTLIYCKTTAPTAH